MMATNKRRGAKTKAQLAAMGEEAPDYWLTEHMFCERCGAKMEGVSGTSGSNGRKYRYYYHQNQRKKLCTAKPMRKDDVEAWVTQVVQWFLDDPEILASLAVDMADHYRKTHAYSDEVLKGLETMRRDVETQLGNFVKVIGMGIHQRETTARAMRAREERKAELDAAIQAEHVKVALHEDETEVRDMLFEYFIDKIGGGPRPSRWHRASMTAPN